MSFSIGQLAKAADVKIPTIRFYEDIGLLPPAARSANDRRFYGADAIGRLAFIRHARQLGFSIEAIRSLLALSDDPDQPCGQANELAARQLAEVEAKINQLETLRSELRRMVDATCNGQASQCRVIEALTG